MEQGVTKRILFIIIIACLAGCGSRKAAAPEGTGRYERPPLREVNEEQLKADGMLIDALALQESGRQNEAMEAYVRITQAYPTCAAAWYEMGRHMMARRWSDSAEHCLARAVKLQPENVWYLKALAQNEEVSGNSKALTETWERIVKVQPTVLENYYNLSNAYITANNLPKAVEVLDRVEKMIGVSEDVSLQKQKLWNAAGKPDKALREVEKLADAYPGETRYCALLAESYMKQKRYDKAKIYYDRIVSQHPENAEAHVMLAEYYRARRQPREMGQELAKAFASPEMSSSVKLKLLGSFYTEEEFYGSQRETAFHLMDLAMEGCEDSAEFAAFYGHVLMQQEKYAEAAHQFALALRNDSSDYDLWEAEIICLTEVPGADERLADYAVRASRLFPTHTLPHYVLALTAYRQQRYDDALKHLDNAMKWGFTKGYLEQQCYALEGECLYRAGYYERCWASMEKRLAKFPDDMEALNNYAYYLAEQGQNLEKAEQMSRRTIQEEPNNANSLDTYAWILHMMGRDREALPYMEKAVKLNPGSETLQKHLKEIKGE